MECLDPTAAVGTRSWGTADGNVRTGLEFRV